MFAMTACRIKLGHADAAAFLHMLDIGPHGRGMAEAFMARNERKRGINGPVATGSV